MKITLVSRDNGVGLTTDMTLLEQLLTPAGHQIQRVGWRSRRMPPCDVAIFLELLNPLLLRYARRSVGIFNLEWFEGRWRRYLRHLTQLWAKSGEAHQLYQAWGLASTFTGFASRDLYDPQVPRARTCLHLRGHSDLKGTETILEAWRRHPDLPPLTVVSAVPLEAPPGVTVLLRLPHDELVRQVNAAQIHLCPSRSEGWGHYITEALSAGAVVVTTDASPMNEQVRPEWGVLVPPVSSRARGFVQEHEVHPEHLAAAVRRAAALPDERRNQMGALARAHVAARNEAFRQTALTLLKGL